MRHWFVATYKINEIKTAETNLKNQKIHYYLPKIVIKKHNLNPKEEAYSDNQYLTFPQ